jgi:hypothetical protein
MTPLRDERVDPVASPDPDDVDADDGADDAGADVTFDAEPPDMPVRSVYETRGVVTVPVWPDDRRRR